MSVEDAATLREDELLALQSIFSAEQVQVHQDHGKGGLDQVTFQVPVELPDKINIIVDSAHDPHTRPSPSSTTFSSLDLRHLPPLTVVARLPHRYPLEEPPRLQLVSGSWAAQETERRWISDRLLELWEECRGEVLWTWTDWLRQGWAEEALRGDTKCPYVWPSKSSIKVTEGTKGGEAAASHTSRTLSETLQAYDRLARQSAFDKDRFMCGICLEAKRGGSCTRITGCSHVFCQECLLNYETLHLTEGSLHLALSCPDSACVATAARQGGAAASATQPSNEDESNGGGTLTVSELEDLLRPTAPALIDRLHFLRDKVAAEADPSAVPCPRQDCQALTPAREEDKAHPRWQAFRQCPQCAMSFCAWCRHVWHAPNPCTLSSSNAILTKYDAASEAGKRQMEMRYGRKNLLKLKAQFEEDKANQAWLRERTQGCPHCSSPVEKSMGCNHMTCSHCHSHFCFCCGTRLNPSNPYGHFNTRGSACFNRLFDGILGPQDEVGGADGEADGGGGVEGVDGVPGGGAGGGDGRRRAREEEEQHMMALAAIQAAFDDL